MKKVVISGMIGNALEWYDYALYAQFFYIIKLKFFPESELSEFLTAAVFAAGFIVRPLGGVFFGNLGDRLGRRLALVLGILTMAVPTAAIGLLPSYTQIGIAAPLILTFIRLVQGFALGGEFSGCIAYMVEHSPLEKRGLVGSTSFVSMCIGMIMGYTVSRVFKYALSEEELLSWGWRIPFILGLVIGLVGMYIRTHLSESPIYKAAKASGSLSKTPLREVFKEYWREVFMAFVVYINVTAPFYTTTVYMKQYMESIGYLRGQADMVSIIILVTMTIMFPISAYISDKIGRKPVIIASNLLLAVSIYPIFLALQHMNYTLAILSQILFAAIVGIYMGPVPTLLVELFPTRVRFTGVAISYNLSAAIFGGTLPMIGVALYKFTGNQLVVSYYLTALAWLGLLIICFNKETYKYDLTDDIIHGESLGVKEALETY